MDAHLSRRRGHGGSATSGKCRQCRLNALWHRPVRSNKRCIAAMAPGSRGCDRNELSTKPEQEDSMSTELSTEQRLDAVARLPLPGDNVAITTQRLPAGTVIIDNDRRY